MPREKNLGISLLFEYPRQNGKGWRQFLSHPTAPVKTAPEPAAQPRCPQCNAPIVLRTATRGANQGGKFWGCPNYPRCRGIVEYEA